MCAGCINMSMRMSITYAHVCTCMFVRTFILMSVHMPAHMLIPMSIRTYRCLYTCLYTCLYMLYTCTTMPVHIPLHVRNKYVCSNLYTQVDPRTKTTSRHGAARLSRNNLVVSYYEKSQGTVVDARAQGMPL